MEEPLVGKEKKRRKLDEIVLGLSAAKEQNIFPESSKKPTITPSVTVTPTSAPVSTSHGPTQKPFTITVTSVPSPAPAASKSSGMPPIIPPLSSSAAKDSFSSFLAQAEQQNLILKKQQQQQRKNYEAMIADINKVADFSSKVNSYSHEAKVNKWLAEQSSLMPSQQLSADYLSDSRRRRSRGGIDPALLDWKKLTDPKWAELIKEQAVQAARGNLQHDLQKHLPSSSSSGASSNNNKKGPGRPPLLASPTGSKAPVSSAPSLPTSLPSSLQFPNLATSGLSGLNSNLLSSLSLGQFDPKTNPLLLPFGGMPNMSALNSMGGLGGLGNMNLFANLAGLGIPGLTGMEGANLANENASGGSSGSASSSKNKPRNKSSNEGPSNKPSVSSSGSTLPTTSPFPFFFPNPSLLYTPLGLGGLNPFSLQPGMSSAYDSLAQQCGLLNGALGVSSASPTTSNRSGKSSSATANSRATTTVTSANTAMNSSGNSSGISNKHRPSSSRDVGSLQQLLLPHDAHLLESISRVAGGYEPKRKENDKKDDKRKALESLSRGVLPPEYHMEKLKSSKREYDKLPPDLSKFMEIPGSSKRREQEMKDAIEQLSKTSAEFIARTLANDDPKASQKRPRETPKETVENLAKDEGEALPPPKKFKESLLPVPETPSIESGGVDIEALLPPSTVVKGPQVVETEEKQLQPQQQQPQKPQEASDHNSSTEDLSAIEKPTVSSVSPGTSKEDAHTESGEPSSKKGGNRRTRGKRKSGELDAEAPVIERKNLRSSAGRAAAAAAARAEAERAAAAKQQQLEAEEAKNKDGNDS